MTFKPFVTQTSSASARRVLLLAVSLVAISGTSGHGAEPLPRRLPSDDQVTLPASDLQALERRLQAAERRLQRIETQRLPPIEAPSVYPTRLESDDEAKESKADEKLQERVEALEKDLEERAADEEKKEAAAAAKPTVKWTGRIHLDYWAFPDDSPGANAFENGDAGDSLDDRFLFRRVRFAIQGSIPDNMFYKAEFDINQPQTPQFKDVYLGWEEVPIFQTITLGQQKRPYGLDHLNSSRYNVFIERPYIVEAVNQDARRLGLSASGFSENLAYNWQYGAFMMQDLQQTGTILTDPVTEDYQAEVAGRFANTIWYDEASDGRGYAHWAVAGTIASPSGRDYAGSAARFQTRPEARTSTRWIDTDVIVGADHYQMAGLEGVLNLGALQLVTEYQSIWMQRDEGFGDDLRFDGGYVYASYFLTGEHMTWDRTSGQLDRVTPFQNFWIVDTCNDGVEAGWGAWQVAARYSTADFTDDDIAGGVGQSMTFGLNWYWNAHAKMQFNYIYGDIEDRAPVDGQTEGTYSIVGTRFMVDY